MAIELMLGGHKARARARGGAWGEGAEMCRTGRTPKPADFTQPGIPPCVSGIMPVIELHNHVMHGTPPSAGELIANNAIHAGFVLGGTTERSDRLDTPELSILIDDNCFTTCKGPQLIETIQSSLQWLQESLKKTGDQLQEGQIILTGSIPSLIERSPFLLDVASLFSILYICQT